MSKHDRTGYCHERVNATVRAVEDSITETQKITRPDELVVGVDLGTSYIVLVVIDCDRNPVATELQYAEVLRDGVVVDYIGALDIVRKLKDRLEARLGVTLSRAAIAMPSNTPLSECKAHRHIVEACGLEVLNILDEPTAANRVLNIKNGAVVDIGGGTTGLSIFENHQMIYTMDEATGGTHLSLVVAGSFGLSFEDAEAYKKRPENHPEVVEIVRPVIEKMGSIIARHIEHRDVDNLFLAGGTTCLPGFETIVEKITGVKTWKPSNPFLVTPMGIAISALDKEFPESAV